MALKNVVRLLVVALIITSFYFLSVRYSTRNPAVHHRRHAGDSGQTHEQNWARSSRPEKGRLRTDGDLGSLEANSGLSCSSEYLSAWSEPAPASCQIRTRDGFPLPDPRCTPGGVNPTVSVTVLRDPRWRTRMVRNCAVSEAQKHIAYRWYGVEKPHINSNQNQVCELDHLVPLELGGADGMGNIWPQCGPDAVTLNERYFKQKDRVENYLSDEVKRGTMQLRAAQSGIASDWTQYIPEATRWCHDAGRC